jgi:hypothetical protein
MSAPDKQAADTSQDLETHMAFAQSHLDRMGEILAEGEALAQRLEIIKQLLSQERQRCQQKERDPDEGMRESVSATAAL